MHPQVVSLIETLKKMTPADAPQLWQMPATVGRPRADAFFTALNAGGPEMAETRDLEVPGPRCAVPARLYVPRNAATLSPGLLYLHGGGFVIGSPDTHDRLTRELAEASGARVLSLHYRLAPENPFPAGLDDCMAAARWLGAHGAEIGIDPNRLAIGGDSAGANLSASTLLRLKDEGKGPEFRAALLIYGLYSDFETPSMKAWGDRDLILSRKVMDWFRAQYLARGGAASHLYVAPLNGELAGFPPAILVVGTLDPLLSDSQLFAAALEKAGVQAELVVYEDGIHAFLQMPMLDMTREAIARLGAFARGRLADAQPAR